MCGAQIRSRRTEPPGVRWGCSPAPGAAACGQCQAPPSLLCRWAGVLTLGHPIYSPSSVTQALQGWGGGHHCEDLTLLSGLIPLSLILGKPSPVTSLSQLSQRVGRQQALSWPPMSAPQQWHVSCCLGGPPGTHSQAGYFAGFRVKRKHRAPCSKRRNKAFPVVSLLTCHSVFHLPLAVVQAQALTEPGHPDTRRPPPASGTGHWVGRWHAPLSRGTSFCKHKDTCEDSQGSATRCRTPLSTGCRVTSPGGPPPRGTRAIRLTPVWDQASDLKGGSLRPLKSSLCPWPEARPREEAIAPQQDTRGSLPILSFCCSALWLLFF